MKEVATECQVPVHQNEHLIHVFYYKALNNKVPYLKEGGELHRAWPGHRYLTEVRVLWVAVYGILTRHPSGITPI